MTEAKFILSKKKLFEQYKTLKDIGLKVSYSYKTNREVGDILQKETSCDISIHAKEEVGMIEDKKRVWFFTQAELVNELEELIKQGVNKFVIDNEIDLERILKASERTNKKIWLSIRMKFQEHRIGTGRYFVYGIPARIVNKLILKLRENKNLERLGVHIHRKSQNTSEWEIKEELKESLSEEALERIDFLNLGGGLPIIYRSITSKVFPYIFKKLKETVEFLNENKIEAYIEPGRFLAAPCINLETEIIQVYENTIVVNTTIYNCALDNVLTNTKMLIKEELSEGKDYLIKGNSPTRDDIFRYRAKLKNPKPGDKITFLYAGAYNYTTDFFGYKKLKNEIIS